MRRGTELIVGRGKLRNGEQKGRRKKKKGQVVNIHGTLGRGRKGGEGNNKKQEKAGKNDPETKSSSLEEPSF